MTVSMGGKWNLRQEGGCEPSETDPAQWSFFPGHGNHSRDVNWGWGVGGECRSKGWGHKGSARECHPLAWWGPLKRAPWGTEATFG